jgi:hypothetical protein
MGFRRAGRHCKLRVVDATLLLLSLISSGIGFVLFTYGRKRAEWLYVAGGLLFMVYPYFTASVSTMVGVGLALGAALYGGYAAGW